MILSYSGALGLVEKQPGLTGGAICSGLFLLFIVLKHTKFSPFYPFFPFINQGGQHPPDCQARYLIFPTSKLLFDPD